MNIKELQEALGALQKAYAFGGASKQAREIDQLVRSLDSHADKSVETLIDEITAGAAAQPDNIEVAATLNDTVIEYHLQALLSANTDRSLFDSAYTKLKADKRAALPELVQIANRYRNAPTGAASVQTFSSKVKALDYIFDTYLGRAQAESKGNLIDRMARWAAS